MFPEASGSCCVAVEVAESWIVVPACAGVGVTVIETVALAPLAIVPSGHVIVPDAFVHAPPWDDVIVPIVTPGGSVLT